MHIADPRLGIFGANGIVAAGLPIANGAAVASQLRHDDSVVVAFFGDGAAAQGAFHEALNLASVWQLPAIFFCENNGYSEFSPTASQHAATLKRRAAGLRGPLRTGGRERCRRHRHLHAGHGRGGPRRVAGPSWWRHPPTAGTGTTRAIPSVTGPTTS